MNVQRRVERLEKYSLDCRHCGQRLTCAHCGGESNVEDVREKLARRLEAHLQQQDAWTRERLTAEEYVELKRLEAKARYGTTA